jgi:hypothetical protein
VRTWAAIGWLSLFCSGCTSENPALELPALDRDLFRCEVAPVLAKQCSAPACHGSGDRYYRLYARNRLRYGVDELDRADPLTPFELVANYDATRALVVGLGRPEDAMLLRKPLEPAAGGYYHGATRVFRAQGHNVFSSLADPEYATLERWARGAAGDPTCVDPGAEP